ncbi:hypothetical protein [Sulfitobacter sediminilitoris]|uniref:hypothetical protein n=1 Tax=Sulfitobacter sediminilitoris TaxID=2698830 RepID=UPI0013D9A310|nr:hypothetical protein [Sulfitobacter sediminilitoris]
MIEHRAHDVILLPRGRATTCLAADEVFSQEITGAQVEGKAPFAERRLRAQCVLKAPFRGCVAILHGLKDKPRKRGAAHP